MAAGRARGLRPGSIVRALLRLALLVGIGFAAGLLIGVVSEEPELLAGHLRGEGETVPLADEFRGSQDRGHDSSENVAVGATEGSAPPSPAPALAGGSIGEGSETPLDVVEPDRPGDPTRLRAPAPDVQAVQAGRVALLESAEKEPTPGLPVVAAAAAPESAVARSAPPFERPGGAEPEVWAIQVGAFSEQASASRLAEGLAEKGYAVELIPATGQKGRWRVRVQPVEGESQARALADRLKREERLPTWVTRMEARSGS